MKVSTKLVREGDLVAEVTVELLDDAGAWSPTLSIDDASKLDDVRRPCGPTTFVARRGLRITCTA